MTISGTYPFGSKLVAVVQEDRAPKRVRAGVYASAVHAKWIGPNNRLLVRALGVASEPTIFWDGSGVDTILDGIKLPKGAGRLEPAEPKFNGPSGRSLDQDFLTPLGITRSAPTYANDAQKAATEGRYVPLASKPGLPAVTLPGVPKVFADGARRSEILGEVAEARAELIVVFGERPTARRRRRTGGFTTSRSPVGRLKLLPLVHPRQVPGQGTHSGA